MAYPRLQVLPNPTLMEFREWADTVVGYNAGLNTELSGDMDWREFADRFALMYPAAPLAESFDDWQSWVDRVRLSLQF